jgi:uncharacterized protein (TIGR00369 family)
MTIDPLESLTVDPRHHVASFFRIERWELPPDAAEGAEAPSAMAGRAPIDAHLRGPGGGLRTGALITVLDSLGGLMSGLAVHPRWIVTTNLMATVAELSHRGPLRMSGRVLRQGRNSVVSALRVVDEGAGDRPVAAATMTSAVLDPGAMPLDFERPLVVPMPPPSGDERTPEDFFCIEPGDGPVTRLRLEDRLRNPWGILHGGALAVLADVAACRAASRSGGPVRAAADTVLHYLQPARVGPIEAHATVIGNDERHPLVRVGIHDAGADNRVVMLASVRVVPV